MMGSVVIACSFAAGSRIRRQWPRWTRRRADDAATGGRRLADSWTAAKSEPPESVARENGWWARRESKGPCLAKQGVGAEGEEASH